MLFSHVALPAHSAGQGGTWRDLEVPEVCSPSALTAGCLPDIGKVVINALNFYERLRFKVFTLCCRL